jgi:hypothetical protein
MLNYLHHSLLSTTGRGVGVCKLCGAAVRAEGTSGEGKGSFEKPKTTWILNVPAAKGPGILSVTDESSTTERNITAATHFCSQHLTFREDEAITVGLLSPIAVMSMVLMLFVSILSLCAAFQWTSTRHSGLSTLSMVR